MRAANACATTSRCLLIALVLPGGALTAAAVALEEIAAIEQHGKGNFLGVTHSPL
jgi:hypothetical protein